MIDIKSLKEQLTLEDYEQIIDALEIPITSRSSKVWSLKGGCHSLDMSDSDSNLKFFTDSRLFTCFSHDCISGGDIIELVLVRKRLIGEDIKFLDAINFIIDNSNISIEQVTRKTQKIKSDFNIMQFIKRYKKDAIDPTELEIYAENGLNVFEDIYPIEWLNENISCDIMDRFEIGYYPYQDQIIIPVRDDLGNLVGIRSRNMRPDMAKYIPTKILNGKEYAFPSSAVLYGLYQNAESIAKSHEVILYEGEKSVLKSNSVGINNSVAMFGLNLSKYQAQMLLSLGIERVIIAIDKDYTNLESSEFDEFVSRVKKIAKRFMGRCRVYVICDDKNLLGLKDSPIDKGKEIFDILYKEKEEVL